MYQTLKQQRTNTETHGLEGLGIMHMVPCLGRLTYTAGAPGAATVSVTGWDGPGGIRMLRGDSAF